jgi:hypothetical protein
LARTNSFITTFNAAIETKQHGEGKKDAKEMKGISQVEE